jgi:hypothetical protein
LKILSLALFVLRNDPPYFVTKVESRGEKIVAITNDAIQEVPHPKFNPVASPYAIRY